MLVDFVGQIFFGHNLQMGSISSGSNKKPIIMQTTDYG